jgi:hypothetical protein
MKITRENLKNIVREAMVDESAYQEFFKKALEKAGKSIPDMSDEEKKSFFNKIDAAWNAKGEKNEELVGNQHKLDVDGDGEIEASDLAALRAGKKKNERFGRGAGVGPTFGSADEPEEDLDEEAVILSKRTAGGNIVSKLKEESESVNEAVKPSQVRSVISRVKKDLMKKWKQKGGYENFGDKEGNMLRDKFNFNPYGSTEEREIAKMIQGFEDWAMNYDGNMREGKKVFKVNPAIGKSKYSISSHDGVKKHKDGSDFFDIKTFKNKVDLEKAIKDYTSKGFKMESVNESSFMDADRKAAAISNVIQLDKKVIKKFIEDNNLDADKIHIFVKKNYPKNVESFVKLMKQPNNSSLKNFTNESVNEIQYKDAVAKFNDELIKHPMVKKAAQHYKKTPAEIVKVLQQRLSTKGNRGGDTKEVSIDFKDTTSGITIKHNKKFNESVNEDFKAVVGKKIYSNGSGKLFFGYEKEDDSVHLVDYNTWKKLTAKNLSNEFMANRLINAIVKGQKQFNKKVDYNMWSKKTNPSFEQRMEYFMKNGWISNINKGGIKESVDVLSVKK